MFALHTQTNFWRQQLKPLFCETPYKKKKPKMSWIEDPGLTTFGGFNISELGTDEAWVNVSTTITDAALWLYEVSTNCHRVSQTNVLD